MEDCDLNDGEFKIGVVKELNKIQYSETQFNELSNKNNDQKKSFTKQIKTIKKKQSEILELNNSINEMKNALKSIGKRAHHIEEKVSKLKDRNRNHSSKREDKTKI